MKYKLIKPELDSLEEGDTLVLFTHVNGLRLLVVEEVNTKNNCIITKDNEMLVLDGLHVRKLEALKDAEILLEEFEIWSEGFRATGQSGSCQLLGRGVGTDFNSAVRNWAHTNPQHEQYVTYQGAVAYYWGCRLFDNQKDASKAFG